jgi:hypothetical protein
VPAEGKRSSPLPDLRTLDVRVPPLDDGVQKGHSTYEITADIYAHAVPELKQVAADAIDEALGGGS